MVFGFQFLDTGLYYYTNSILWTVWSNILVVQHEKMEQSNTTAFRPAPEFQREKDKIVTIFWVPTIITTP